MLRSVSLALVVLCLVGCGGGAGGFGADDEQGGLAGPPSSDAALSALEISSGKLTPEFDPAVTAYTVGPALLPGSVSVIPTAADAGARITVDGAPVDSGAASGPVLLPIGTIQIITVTVTAEDGITQTNYAIAVTRDDPAREAAYMKATNTDADDFFGYDIAMSGNTLVIGAPYEDSAAAGVGGSQSSDSAENTGAAYVYAFANGTWTLEAYLKASNPDDWDRFGWRVDIEGDTVVVSAPFESSGVPGVQGDNTESAAGAVYVFTRDAGTWSQEAYLKPRNPDAGDQFGRAVSLSGNTLAVGAQYEASTAQGIDGDDLDNGLSESGAVFVFTRTGSTWSQEAYIKASNTGFEDLFGYAVAVDGNTLAVGARREASSATGVGGDQFDDAADASGAVYVFTRSGTTWSQEAYIKATNTDATDYFGTALDLVGDTLAVGAPGEAGANTLGGNQNDNSLPDAGAVYVYVRSGSTWSLQEYVKHPDPDGDDSFGASVSLAHGMLLVGAPGDDGADRGLGGDATDNGSNQAGAAVFYALDTPGWTFRTYIKSSNADAADALGHSTAIRADGGVLAVGTINEASDQTGPNPPVVNDLAPGSGAVYLFR